MKLIALTALSICALPTFALAQSPGVVGYIEGSVGAAFISNIDTKPLAASAPGLSFNGRGEVDFGNAFIAGAELGTGGLLDGDLRLGISYDYTNAKVNSIKLIGTANGVPVNQTYPRATLTSLGITGLDANVHIVSANLYYNLPLIGEAIRPYLGIGVGAAMIERATTELQFSGDVGFRYAISQGAYVGGRYRIMRVQGPQGDDGVKYDPFVIHTISAVLGFYLP